VTVKHTYRVRKQPLYGDVQKTGKKEIKTRGRKRKAEEAIDSASKENVAPAVNRIVDDAATLQHSTLQGSHLLHPSFALMYR